MESFSELIKARRSMRKFTEEELTQEQVVTLMKAALMAPTSKRSNAWQFIVVDDKDTLKKLKPKSVLKKNVLLLRLLPTRLPGHLVKDLKWVVKVRLLPDKA